MITRRDVLSTAAAAFAATYPVPRAFAQPLSKTVHILNGFSPGFQDAMARLVAGQMSGYAETIVVENRPGAGGRIAVEAVKNADADGSAMLFAPLGFMMFSTRLQDAEIPAA
jgi:tripartite-type tricarboxylate transporter receptor subunit TctC